jgi:L-alanine-DL-glutamate epimerase-like enolase superfamily enzyme
VASLEAVYERHDFRPYLDAYAVDVALVDVMFNGYLESLKIASLADVYEVNVTPHNFYSHFSSYIAAHFSASVPNLRIMEIDIDGAPLRDELIGGPPPVERGEFILPTTPGWGVEVDEAVLRRRAVNAST